jgi:nicotinamidase-related amidase
VVFVINRRVILSVVVATLSIVLLVGTAVGQVDGPRLPVPQPVTVDPSTTALVVLDMSTRCNDPGNICHELAPVLGAFLPRARASGILIVYTVSASAQGTPLGEVWPGFERRPEEIVVYPDGFDKFHGPELREVLEARGIHRVIITGASANQAVLYSVSGAARNWHYDIVLPLDGTMAESTYEYEYTMHQLNRIQGSGGISPFAFTTLDQLEFAP